MTKLVQTSRFDQPSTVEDAVARYIDETYYGDGRLEAMQHRVKQQERVILALIRVLPEKHQLNLARELFGKSLKVLEQKETT